MASSPPTELRFPIGTHPVPVSSAPLAKNRGRLDMVCEVLAACNKGGANKSRIMLRANINSLVATNLLTALAECGLIERGRDESGTTRYLCTRRGNDFVNKYLELTSMLCQMLRPPSSSPHAAPEWLLERDVWTR